jgi:NADH-quinone oxidoreductase subunit L
MKLSLALILLFPLFGGVVNALLGRRLPRRVVETLACGVMGGSFLCALRLLSAYRKPVTVELLSWMKDFDFEAPVTLYLDSLSLTLILMITFVCGLIHLYSVGYMKDDPGYGRYFALLNLFVFAMLTLILAENLPLLYLGWEGVGFCSYALIGFWYGEEKNVDAGRKAFIVTRVGDTFLGIAMVWMFQLFGTLSITQLNGMGFLMPVGVLTGIGLMLLAGATGKSAQVPLMVWLPDAMAGPTPVSALIHAATMVTAGVYLMMRMMPLVGASTVLHAVVALTGGITAFYAATCALAQRDLKRVLAYSTMSQMGYLMLAVGAGAITAATYHLVVHAFFKALLFLGAGCIITASHHEQDLYKLGGLKKGQPLLFWSFLAGAACLAGLPLTGGFFSKDAILMELFRQGTLLSYLLYGLGLVTAFLTSLYTFRMIYLLFGGEERHTEKLPAVMLIPLIPLAIMAFAGELINLPEFIAKGALAQFLSPLNPLPKEHSFTQELLLMAVAGVTSLAGLAVAHFRYSGAGRAVRIAQAETPSVLTRFFLNGWYVDDLYRFLFIRPYEAIARFLWLRVDKGGIDGGLDGLGASALNAGEALGRWTTGRVSVYLLSLAAGAAVIVGWLAWS